MRRAFGSTVNRRFPLHNAESGGSEVVVPYVQTDGSSRIQHYSDNTADVDFVLLGYSIDDLTGKGRYSWRKIPRPPEPPRPWLL